MSTGKVKAAALLIDENLYPRHKVDRTNVQRLRQAIRAGEELPPVVADRKTKKATDGIHRITAHLEEIGEDAEVVVEWRDYPDDGAMLLDAIDMNAAHGWNLQPWDRVRSIALAQEMKISTDQIAKALRVTEEEVVKLSASRTVKQGSQVVPIKAGLGHLTKRKGRLSKRQIQGNEDAGGLRRTYYVNEVIRDFEQDLGDWDNPKYVERLIRLRGLLNAADLTVPTEATG